MCIVYSIELREIIININNIRVIEDDFSKENESSSFSSFHSHELQTCDWPRNVGCPEGGSPIKEAEEDPLLERWVFLLNLIKSSR